MKNFERYAASVLSIIAYGRRISSVQDPVITNVIAVMQVSAALNVPGERMPTLMETFPILAKFSMAKKMTRGRGRESRCFTIWPKRPMKL